MTRACRSWSAKGATGAGGITGGEWRCPAACKKPYDRAMGLCRCVQLTPMFMRCLVNLCSTPVPAVDKAT
eukprot:COSAG01_NODE_956_length_12480_cov_109.564090_8_plen_70_part_00